MSNDVQYVHFATRKLDAALLQRLQLYAVQRRIKVWEALERVLRVGLPVAETQDIINKQLNRN
ncbi:TPA: hypothetical protein HA278_00995 [Candidatus Woesearchaeota archaeon]|nr:hypothetical protein [Candidatus Woesearchaeota archaeon]